MQVHILLPKRFTSITVKLDQSQIVSLSFVFGNGWTHSYSTDTFIITYKLFLTLEGLVMHV